MPPSTTTSAGGTPKKRPNAKSKSQPQSRTSEASPSFSSSQRRQGNTRSNRLQSLIAMRKKPAVKLVLLACSASLFLMAFLTYRNGGQLPLKRVAHPRPLDAVKAPPPSPSPNTHRQFAPSLPFHLPPIHPLPRQPSFAADTAKQAAILEAFQWSWSAYTRDAWGYDEYHPIDRSGSNLNGKNGAGMGYTIVDTLDTLILMGFKDDYEKARDWVQHELHWDVPGRLNVFETTIRTLGGLLSASALMQNPPHPAIQASKRDANMFLDKAVELAERLLPAFETPTGIPLREVDLMTGEAFADRDNFNSSSLAEATTLQLEFKYLAHLTGEKKYWRIAERPMEAIRTSTRMIANFPGILPIFLSPTNGHFYNADIRLGSRGDSYYEYLIKQWIQTARTENVYRDMYDNALFGIKTLLTRQSLNSTPPLVYTIELLPTRQRGLRPVPKQDHLVCFLGGAMMLGATSLHDKFGQRSERLLAPISATVKYDGTQREDWRLGHELTRTCYDTYNKTKTGLGAEIVMFRTKEDETMAAQQRMMGAHTAPVPKHVDWYIKQPPKGYKGMYNPLIDARNILRPETVESLFVAFSLTGDDMYREWGWHIFQAFDKWCRVETGGYSSIDDVDSDAPRMTNKMETFWLSETLKYLYLLFSDRDTLPLDKWVLNTEAHPLPVFKPIFATGFT